MLGSSARVLQSKKKKRRQAQETALRAYTTHQGQFKVPADFVTPQTPILYGSGIEPGLKIYEFQVISMEAAQRPWTDNGLFFLNFF